MNDSKIRTWVQSVVRKTPDFLDRMKDKDVPGRFRYSLSGDIKFPFSWGLANTVFATKTYYMLNEMNLADVADMSRYIKSYQGNESYIFDPVVQLGSWPLRIFNALRSCDFNNFFGEQNKRAETRQAFAALMALGDKPDIPFNKIPYTKPKIKDYIHSLNWEKPWGAASHFSHLVFFLAKNNDFFKLNSEATKELLAYAFDELETYKQEDGAWYTDDSQIEDYQKVNGGMKIMTAFGNYTKRSFEHPKKLIDLCFSSLNSGNACNHFNIICLLYHCSRKTDYKKSEISDYLKERLILYKEHWWEESGGFSFFPRNANRIYYDAYISKGRPEPDIHGTHLFLWGIVLICNALEWNEYGLQEPIT